MKKSLGIKLLAVGAALLTLAGCGQSAAKSSEKAAPVKITYWHRMTGSYETALNHLITQFNQSQSKYKVVATSQNSYNALQQKIMAAAKSKTLPTMAQAPTTNLGDYVKNNFLLAWDDSGRTLPSSIGASIYPSFLDSGEYQKKLYGLPFSVSTQVLFYNKDLVSQHKLALPKTWSDFDKIQGQLKGTKLTALALDNSYDVQLEGLAKAAGSQLITPEGKANLASAQTLKAANMLLGMKKAGSMRTAGEDWYFDVALVNKQAVFGIGSSASIPDMQSRAKGFKWATAQVPTYGGSAAMPLNGNDNVLFKGASKKQQAGAFAFAKFLMQPKQAAYWAEKSGYVPVTTAASETASYKAYLKAHPEYQAPLDAVQNSFASAVFAGYGDYRNDLMSAVDSTLTKKVSGDAAFKKLQSQTEAILKANQ